MGTSSTPIHREHQSSPTDRPTHRRRHQQQEKKKTNQKTDILQAGLGGLRAGKLPLRSASARGRSARRTCGTPSAASACETERDKKRNVRRRRRVLRRAGGTTRAWRRKRGTRGERGAGEAKRGTGREGKGREGKRDLWRGRWPTASGGGEREGDAFYRWNCYGRTKARPDRPPLSPMPGRSLGRMGDMDKSFFILFLGIRSL